MSVVGIPSDHARLEAVTGSRPGEQLDPDPDELRHQRLVIAARRRLAASERR